MRIARLLILFLALGIGSRADAVVLNPPPNPKAQVAPPSDPPVPREQIPAPPPEQGPGPGQEPATPPDDGQPPGQSPSTPPDGGQPPGQSPSAPADGGQPPDQGSIPPDDFGSNGGDGDSDGIWALLPWLAVAAVGAAVLLRVFRPRPRPNPESEPNPEPDPPDVGLSAWLEPGEMRFEGGEPVVEREERDG